MRRAEVAQFEMQAAEREAGVLVDPVIGAHQTIAGLHPGREIARSLGVAAARFGAVGVVDAGNLRVDLDIERLERAQAVESDRRGSG